MLRGLYIAGAGMDANRTRAEALSANLANLATPGYKRETVAFAPFLNHALVRGRDAGMEIGRSDYGVAVDHFAPDLAPGPLRFTGRPTDVALAGDGFFTVETSDGEAEAYTRGGEFNVDAEGYLATAAGDRVLGEGGAIQVTGSFSVDAAGNVRDATGEILDRLRVTVVDDPAALAKGGDNRFVAVDPSAVSDTEDFQVRTGVLEGANVDLANEMAEMVKVTRAYEAAQRLVRAHDQLAERAISQVGSVR